MTFAYLRGEGRPPLANLGQEENDIAYLRWRRADPPSQIYGRRRMASHI